jgi:KAP family P-loop domain
VLPTQAPRQAIGNLEGLGHDASGPRYVWGTWTPTKPSLLAVARADGTVEVWRVPLGVAEHSAAYILESHRNHVFKAPSRSSRPWGAWAVVSGVPVLAIGRGGAVWLWRMRDGEDVPVELDLPVDLTGRAPDQDWGAWGEVDGVPVLATGGGDKVAFWDGRDGSPWRPPVKVAGGTVVWGGWANIGDVPMLAIGTYHHPDGAVQLWNSREEQFVAEVSTGRGAVLWGAWAEVDGAPVLATGSQDELATAHQDCTVRLWNLVFERSVQRRPTYRSDVSVGADRLDRSAEATALAELLLSRSARPPLAVGLFGEWGEGKSYFLGLLKDRVTAIAEGPDVFAHHHVRQIRFNAWHYAETDLWASLVAEIFAQLAHPSSNRDVSSEQREQSRLVAEVIADRQLYERIAAEHARTRRLEESLKPAKWDLLSSDKKGDLKTAVARADQQMAEEMYRAVTAPAAWLQMMWMRTGQVWRAIPWWAKWVAPVALCAVVGLVYLFVAVPGFVPRILTTVLGLLPSLAVLASVWKATKERANRALATLQSVREAVKKVVAGWEQQVRTALDVSRANVRALEQELQNLTAAGQLAGLVFSRAAAGGYRQSLGLMTQIREDFETMSALLTRDQTEYSEGQLAGLDRPDAGGDSVPRIDRIVLYVDDLDRCPPRRVVELLEAVHLLLAVPLFVVVVAVDPRWLLRAIALHYRDVLSSATNALTTTARASSEIDPDDEEYWASSPAQYLEKIFQVVFTLPAMTTVGYTSLLDAVIGPRADIDMSEISAALFNEPRPQPIGDKTFESQLQPPVDTTEDATHADSEDTVRVVELPKPPLVDRPDPLALDSAELTLIRLLGPPLISTPRAVKRLANSYGLLAAIRRLRDPTSTADTLQAMILLAALVGYPNLGPSLLMRLHRDAIAQPDLPWKTFVDQLRERNMDSHVEEEAQLALAGALDHVTKRAATAGIVLPEAVSDWASSIRLVGRLSFPAGSVAARLDRLNPPA